jgi:hypothetical protein
MTKQIKYWAKLGKAAEANKDLPDSMVLDILVSIEEGKAGTLKEYKYKFKWKLKLKSPTALSEISAPAAIFLLA